MKYKDNPIYSPPFGTIIRNIFVPIYNIPILHKKRLYNKF